MNYFIDSQIQNIITTLKTFNQSCKIAAIHDDGKLDKTEAKAIRQIESATDKYIKELEKIRK